MERIAIIGASRGLGAALAKEIAGLGGEHALLLISRKQAALEKLKAELVELNPKLSEVQILLADLAKEDEQGQLLDQLQEYAPSRIFYCAGGGPFGAYESKKWKDHMWAFQLCFLFPAQLLHWSMNYKTVRQLILVGSSVAENKIEIFAASYSVAKRAQRAVFDLLGSETGDLDFRLFSPGYMDTELLPKNAEPRHLGEVWPVSKVAQKLWQWAQIASMQRHLSLSHFVDGK